LPLSSLAATTSQISLSSWNLLDELVRTYSHKRFLFVALRRIVAERLQLIRSHPIVVFSLTDLLLDRPDTTRAQSGLSHVLVITSILFKFAHIALRIAIVVRLVFGDASADGEAIIPLRLGLRAS
jgi:multisubunit Na+/H+ antiporter MnhC subunit